MSTDYSRLLTLAGKMSDAARNIVGGNVLTVGRMSSANVYNISEACKVLRDAVDDYDRAIIEAMERSKQ
jgi:hypothetical protein